MRKVFVGIVMTALIGWNDISAQKPNGVYSSTNSPLKIEEPSSRTIYGGTIINVTYKGSKISQSVKGAFEYACKLVEDIIPTTYPINVTVGFVRMSDSKCLASVSSYTDNVGVTSYSLGTDKIRTKRIVQILGGEFKVDEEKILDFFESADVNIDFASNQPFDYSLDPSLISSQKYDFVTVAIQALLKATGFVFKATCTNEELVALPTENDFTHALLVGNTPSENYIMATSGNAYMQLVSGNTKWPLVSDAPYKPGISLNYFAADHNNVETAIMQYGIAKGSYIRYIGQSIDDYFTFCGWKRDIATGIGGADVFNTTNSDNVIAYRGMKSASERVFSKTLSKNNENLQDYLSSRAEANEEGKYVLLKNGAWRKYRSLSELSDNENYARTVEGYLKLKEVSISWGAGQRYYNWIVDYYLYDYVPQKPKAELDNYTESEENLILRSGRSFTSYSDEDVYVDVEIGICNLEGTTRVTVEQTDADYPVPYTYDVENFKTGKFIAYMNKRYPSTFKVTYINKNGSVTGDSFTIDLKQEANQFANGKVNINNNIISYDFTNAVPVTEYEIRDWPSGMCKQTGMIYRQGNIDVSSLSKGFYVLVFRDKMKKVQEIKWSK